MPDEPRPLRSGRYYTEVELAAHALRAVDAVTGRGRKPYPTRAALAAALSVGRDKPVSAPALSAALALADPSRPAAEYDRGASVRRLILRRLLGFVVVPAFGVEEAPAGDLLKMPEPQ